MKIMPTKTTTKKTAADVIAGKPTAKKPAAPRKKKEVRPTQEDLALRAYFLAEKRQKLGLPGDALADWIEAERQLVAESGPKRTPKKT